MDVVLSDKARSDLLATHRYFEQRSANAADAFIRRVNSNFENLARFPFLGRDRSSLVPGLRCLIVGLYLVFYTIGTERITIVRVIDARMDVDEEFYR